jgi:hypothetical protein
MSKEQVAAELVAHIAKTLTEAFTGTTAENPS